MTSFIDHLKYLLALTDSGRAHNNDWKELKRLLKEAGHWKNRPGGKPFEKGNKFAINKEDQKVRDETWLHSPF
jgi:hypothetical protein